ncbi:MAG: tetratricopeptide repeat protein [Acidobacteriota bacterium]
MNRILVAIAVVALSGCSTLHHHRNTDQYANPFYAKYLNGSNALDQQIQRDITALRAHPDSPALHNDLGQLLVQKGFPKDAEVEFERSVDADSHFYPAWYNLGLVRASRDEASSARFAFRRAVHYKPGHAAALFQLGLIEETRGNDDAAVEYYAKAFSINHALLDVHVNPRILDSKLVDLALIRKYSKDHNRASMVFNPTPDRYVDPSTSGAAASQAASPQAAAQNIVTPSAPVTSLAAQSQVPPPQPKP